MGASLVPLRILSKLLTLTSRFARRKDPSDELRKACGDILVRMIVRRERAQIASDRLAEAKHQYANELQNALLVAAEAKKVLDEGNMSGAKRLVDQARNIRFKVSRLRRKVEDLEYVALGKTEEINRSRSHCARTIGQYCEFQALQSRFIIEQQSLLIERKTEWISRVASRIDDVLQAASSHE